MIETNMPNRDYPHLFSLHLNPNVSHVPSGAWVGLRNALIIMAVLFGLVALAIWKGGL